MKVSDILRVKGNTLYTVTPDEPLARALEVMADKDIGSLVVMEQGALAGMLTFREVIKCVVKHAGTLSDAKVRAAMDAQPRSCSFYDVARAIVETEHFENRMLKAYIRDWPAGEEQAPGPQL